MRVETNLATVVWATVLTGSVALLFFVTNQRATQAQAFDQRAPNDDTHQLYLPLVQGKSSAKPAELVPTTDPSGLTLRLNQVIYADGDELTLVLESGDIALPSPLGQVIAASPGSGDVEPIALSRRSDGHYVSATALSIAEQEGESVPLDGILELVPGERFAAVYYIDHSLPPLVDVDEDLIGAIALFAGGDTSIAPVEIIPDLAMTDDERVPSPGGKPIGTLLPEGTIPVQVATEEVMLFPRSDEELARFLQDTGGEIIGTQEGDIDTLPTVLIAVKPPSVPPTQVAQLRELFGEEGRLIASNSAVLDLYAFLLSYQIHGYIVAANPRLQFQGAPALQAPEASAVRYTMKMIPARTTTAPCIPGDLSRPCVNNVPAVWAFANLWGADRARINLAVLDMGFATNSDFRPLSIGSMVECNMNVFGIPNCGPGRAQGSPTVGNSFFGGRSWHGTGVVATASGVVNNGFGAAGVGGQVAVPMLYKYDLGSYAFEMGSGIRKAVNDGASCINISAGYPCNILTNIGPDFNICTVAGRIGVCTVAAATLFAAAATTCAVAPLIPIAGPIACIAALGGATAGVALCVSTLAFGDVAAPMSSAVRFAASRGVPVVTIAGNALTPDTLPPVIRDLVALGNQRTEAWGIIPAMAPEAIVVGAVDETFTNDEFFGNRVDIWAPTWSAYVAPSDVDNPGAPLRTESLGGTSGATPFIAGLITVMQALNPDLNPHTVGLSDAQRRAIVSRLRDIFTSDAINFTNAELVALGFGDQPIERRRLVNPLAVVQAAAAGKVPDIAALGYDTSLNFSEQLTANADDTSGEARPFGFGAARTGSLIVFPQEGSTPTPVDNDWLSLTMPDGPADRVYQTTITLRRVGSVNGSASLTGDNVMLQGGWTPEEATYRLLGSPSTAALINVSGSRSVYTIAAAAAQLAVPVVSITRPAGAAEFCAGTLSFAATASYTGATTLSVPTNAYRWSLSGVGEIGIGPDVVATLAPGAYTLTVVLFGDTAIADSRELTVINCTGAAPAANITVPATDSGPSDVIYGYDGFDPALGLSYADIEVSGEATDPEDGTLSGASLVWTTNRTDLQAAVLGEGNSLTIRLYSNSECGGVWHEVTLIARDSNGNPSPPVTRRIRIWGVC